MKTTDQGRDFVNAKIKVVIELARIIKHQFLKKFKHAQNSRFDSYAT